MTAEFKPLLAAPVEFDKLDYENLWLSPKLDGIRAVVINGVLMSRSLKPIPNAHIQSLFGHLEHYDGELIYGDPTSPSVYRDTNSAVMTRDGTPNVSFHVFDHIERPEDEYADRYARLVAGANVHLVEQHGVGSQPELEWLEEKYLELGYEGVMLRKARGPNAKYKFGRSTAKAGTLLKVKRFTDSEYEVIGFEELLHNENEATTDELGYTKRSSHAENKIGGNTLGALVLRHPEAGEFRCGTGFTAEMRAEIWTNRDTHLGRLAKIKHFEIGVKTLPRFPVFLGWREEIDL